jgi:hypothetical protein
MHVPCFAFEYASKTVSLDHARLDLFRPLSLAVFILRSRASVWRMSWENAIGLQISGSIGEAISA